MNSKTLILTIAASLAWGGFTFAADDEKAEAPKPDKPQRPEGDKPDRPKGDRPDRPKGERPEGGRPPGQGAGGGGVADALKKLDKDGNGTITKEEAGDAWSRIGRMDKNEDGAIGKDEIPAARPAGPGGRPPGQPGGPGGGGMTPEMVTQIFGRVDQNGDGKITAEEAGERWERLAKADTNEDNGVDKEEFGKAMAAMAAMRGRGEGRPGGGGEMFDRNDTNKDGKITKEEAGERWQFLGRLDKNEDGAVTKEEAAQFGGGRPGGGTPGKGGPGRGGAGGGTAGMFDRFDKDGDGKLAKEEIPEEMWANLSKADEDADGRISKGELEKVFSQRPGGGTPPQGAKGKGKGKGDSAPGRPEGEKPAKKDEA